MNEPPIPKPDQAEPHRASGGASASDAAHIPSRHFGDSLDSDSEYRPPSGLAIAALVLGLASPVALVGPLWWIVPAAAIAPSATALVRLAAVDQAKFGRRAALAGLCLGSVFLAAAPASLLTSQWWLENEARGAAVEWFDYLRHGQPQKAVQLGLAFELRQPLDENLWTYYREHPEAKRELEAFAQQPLIRALLALGEGAQVRFYETQEINRGAKTDSLIQVYAVTYDDGKKKSFFVRLALERTADPRTGQGRWRVVNAGGGIRPRSWAY